ncbi:MAG: hypothetical protein A2233_02100 [Candidatus Kerfeldbacteria bacterium RIFOXYA2_FULL_38_24]|uniref:Type IV pilus modification protein PilV n=1 Tax=Candidatus Kerfeldbacteria bacterium RIFOXYB2_FULL_38_14 TaxID=1798547 RepID=A0A1G2BHL8_9BACT|nr:MAG: hypothetical protein A2319_04700 [Candidatus Kerfeldbacteria bacterium RIFOXYB2_FULL_38_14]OGY87907.1 MAG: hypothetical protein A2233_02100 [Candidatus Kerfeldbacteria bacterium RIFOXYA2_FULL_38_24]OGY88678.1 MAG: hypothetical protein A2458_03505 [Candidatus Kerfeldbacteria bacterium RIFOXYC2_FULL_38_9]
MLTADFPLKKFSTSSGFTLLEAVIATAIVVIGLVSLVVLATLSVMTSRQINEQFQAALFAQEGLEAVRALRDSNWLMFDTNSTTAWNENLFSSANATDYSAVLNNTPNDPALSHSLDFTPNDFDDQCLGQNNSSYACSAIWYDQTSEKYFQTTQTDFIPNNFQQTTYSRLIYLYPICRNTLDDHDEQIIDNETQVCTDLNTATATYQPVGLDVVVSIQWAGRGKMNNYQLEEYLYDWRY